MSHPGRCAARAMFTAEKRSVVASWGAREHAGGASAPRPVELRYRCSGCQAVENLDEAAAVVCTACGSRILTKETRKGRRVFATD